MSFSRLSTVTHGVIGWVRRRLWWVGGAAVVVAGMPLALALVLSHDSPCGTGAAPQPASAQGAPVMRAAVRGCYGPPGVLKLASIPRPVPGPDEVLVQVRAAALNPLDSHLLRGTPYPLRLLTGLGAPADRQLGEDFAGTVVAVGSKAQRFKVGDQVFGAAAHTYAEYVTVSEGHAMALKPGNVSFIEAAAAPVAAMTALQALRDRVRPDDAVLINGASGGVGTYAVQLATYLGAEVTGVCSTRNVAMVRELGARKVIDYTQADFTRGAARYDLIVDAVGNHPLGELRRVLRPRGTVVLIGAPPGNWAGPLSGHIEAGLLAPLSNQVIALSTDLNRPEDLQALADLMQGGRIRSFIERIYPLAQLPEALRFLETGHARGKVVIELP